MAGDEIFLCLFAVAAVRRGQVRISYQPTGRFSWAGSSSGFTCSRLHRGHRIMVVSWNLLKMSLNQRFYRDGLLSSSPEVEEPSSLTLVRFFGLSRVERSVFSVLTSAVERDRFDPLRPYVTVVLCILVTRAV